MVTNTFYEFFAGGGMVRAGLGPERWRCLFANDFDPKKTSSYSKNWGASEIKTADINLLTTADLPARANLIWASFPCQDLSLAGVGAGLAGGRSGTFWPFWRLLKSLVEEQRGPEMVVLENVCGTLSSHGGADFANICSSLGEAGFRVGAVVVDSALFVPQSRQRLFVIGVKTDLPVPERLLGFGPNAQWHPKVLRTAFDRLSLTAQRNWIWWRLTPPPITDVRFADLIEDEPASVQWHSPEQTDRLLSMMSPLNLTKVENAKRAGHRMVGTIYRRTRAEEGNKKVQRAEVRFDDIAGCLRTPAGGSSRQVILVVDGDSVRSRLISARETARLMGLPDTYVLPDAYNEAYHLTGDGVVVPVVEHLARHLFEPFLETVRSIKLVAA